MIGMQNSALNQIPNDVELIFSPGGQGEVVAISHCQ
jgi:hypothetical protein